MKPRYVDSNPTLLDHAAQDEARRARDRAAVAAEWQSAPERSTTRAGRKAYDKASLFLKELSRIIRYSGDGGAYYRPDGRKFILAAMPSIGAQCGGFDGLRDAPMKFEREVFRFRDLLVPGVPDAEIDEYVQDALQDAELRHSQFRTADETALMIGLTMEVRTKLGVTQIGAIDLPKAGREALRKDKAKARAQRNRAKRPGYVPRNKCKAEWRRAKASELKISESTVRRMIKAGDLTYSATSVEQHEQGSFAAEYRAGANEPCSEAVHPPLEQAARTVRPKHTVGADGPTPGGKAKPVQPNRTVALPLPTGEGQERERDLLDTWEPLGSVVARIVAPLVSYEGGPFTSVQRKAARDWLRHQGWSHKQFGLMIGVSRQQITNSLRQNGQDNFGSEAAARLRALLPIAA